MAKKIRVLSIWQFIYEIGEIGHIGKDHLLGEQECFAPEQTKLGKQLKSMLQRDDVCAIKFKIKSSNGF